MARDVNCMSCLVNLARGLEDEGQRYVDFYGITHAVIPSASSQGLQACDMLNARFVGWVVRYRKTCRVLIRHGGVWS